MLRHVILRACVLLVVSIHPAHGEAQTKTDDVSGQSAPLTASDTTSASKTTKNPNECRILFGPEWYSMRELTAKLKLEGNDLLGDQRGYAVECSVVPIPSRIAGIFSLPAALELITATSTTTHAGEHGAATVAWRLPAVTFSLAPELSIPFGSSKTGRRRSIYVRPSIGISTLGMIRLAPAELTVSDRNGRLLLRGIAPTFSLASGVKVPMGDRVSLLGEVGYRYLQFSSVDVTAVDGFTETFGGLPVRDGKLNERLDYSGPRLRFGVAFPF